MRRVAVVSLASAVVLLLSACMPFDVQNLSSDAFDGRKANTPGGAAARTYILDQLRPVAAGLIPGQTGDAAYLQPFAEGTNILAVVRGTEQPDEYVFVGAHYDHEGHDCRVIDPADTICNGATDNATGVAAVLEQARRIGKAPLRRSVVFAFWDAEEEGLLGSASYARAPVVPVSATKAYVNLDMLGSNQLPSLRTNMFAVGAETGGPKLQAIVDAADGASPLELTRLTAAAGDGYSDQSPFWDKGVPGVFLTDSAGPCYHSTEDEYRVVDQAKLYRQIDLVSDVLTRLSDPSVVLDPSIVRQFTYGDAVAIQAFVHKSDPDSGLLTPENQVRRARVVESIDAMVAAGPSEFTMWTGQRLAGYAFTAMELIESLPCDGYLLPAGG